jgi:hypothetical protein
MRQPRTGRFGRGRSVGVAEHRTITVLTRLQRATPVAAVLVALATLFVPATAQAQSTTDRVSATRAAIDRAANRWFGAQQEAARLDSEIHDLEVRIEDMRAQVAKTQVTATARALLIYKGAGASASVALSGVMGDDALESARRAELIDHANEESQRAIDALNAATDDLAAKRDDLAARRDEEKAALAEVANERTVLDQQLANLRSQATREQRVAGSAVSSRTKVTKRSAAAVRPVVADVASPALTPTTPPASGGVSPHHNDPFLVCTRARESNGQYGAVSPAGYYGAYQFAPTTWDATAAHAGRYHLIGVLPSRASVYNQDEQAWTLYQWQGKGPWGGRC